MQSSSRTVPECDSRRGFLSHLVQMEDISNLVQIEVRKVSARRRERHPSSFLVFDDDIRSLSVDSNAHRIEFHREEFLLKFTATCIKHHDY